MAHPALLLVLLLSSPAISSSKRIQPKFPAIFYFGDSVLDTGNNNRLPTVALANHVPYGRDFPGKKPTGRFSNGRLVPDLLNQRLQLKEFSPPYLDSKLSNNDIMTGVNFASAGSGFDDKTSQLANTLPMSKQSSRWTSSRTTSSGSGTLLEIRTLPGSLPTPWFLSAQEPTISHITTVRQRRKRWTLVHTKILLSRLSWGF